MPRGWCMAEFDQAGNPGASAKAGKNIVISVVAPKEPVKENPEVKPQQHTARKVPASKLENLGAATTAPVGMAKTWKSVSELITEIYAGKVRRGRLKDAEWRALVPSMRMMEHEHLALVQLAAQDVQLEKTKHLILMLAVIDHRSVTLFLEGFAAKVLLKHPAFQAEACQWLLAAPREQGSVAEAISAVTNAAVPPGIDTIKEPAAWAKCKDNALHCLLALLASMQRITYDQVLNYVHQHIWVNATRLPAGELEAILMLLQTSGMDGARLVHERAQALRQEYQDDLSNALNRQRVNENNAQSLAAQLEEATGRLRELQERANALQVELAAEKASRDADRRHAEARFDALRSRVMRRLRSDASLLEEGLNALRRDPPKVHVMLDHADRVLESLRSEIEQLA